MEIPFFKAHGAGNDFLLSWRHQLAPGADIPAAARAICQRHTGIGADGWMLMEPAQKPDADASIVLYNADGSVSEISGNGTRCVAAFLLDQGLAPGPEVRIGTGAGLKHLRLLHRSGRHFELEMNMGLPRTEDLRGTLALAAGPLEVAILNVGNPQCAVVVEAFPADWRATGAEIERHPRFPNRTNVSFLRVLDPHRIEVRIWERGVGETNSSGTGSTGAAAASILRGLTKSPVTVETQAGPLEFRWDESMYLSGPAEIIGSGVFL